MLIQLFSICLISFYILMLFSFLLFFMFMIFIYFNLIYFIEFKILSLNSVSVEFSLLFDWMSLLFMSIVLMISGLIIMYSMEYMKGDKFINRFIMLVLMFVFSMMLLIISPNLVSILLGWDGLGLVSYCLVIYFQNFKSLSAGMLTALSNRLGDIALLISIAWMLNFGSWNYIFYLNFYLKDNFIMLNIMIMVMLAAMTKSAQLPFSSWLPAAMAAPTPVSALVHSSTLVTAGVYLLIRFSVLLNFNLISQFILMISGLTMFMSGLAANFEYDLKKIIALSTLSQLGLMMMILSMGFSMIAFFHLLTHAMFKALLFMCAGSIIHNMMNSQDIRSMGGLCNLMPLTSSFFLCSNLALCGMPFLTGFYSKDLILELSLDSYLNLLIFFFFFFSTGLTVSYTFRLIYYSMILCFNGFSFHSINDESYLMLNTMLFLVLFSIFGGCFLMWLIFPNPIFIILPLFMKYLTLIVCFLGGIFGYFLNMLNFIFLNKLFYNINFIWFLSNMWFIPTISTNYISKFPLVSGQISKFIDQNWSEYFGSQNLYLYLVYLTSNYQLIQLNNMKLYLFSFMVWFLIVFMNLN